MTDTRSIPPRDINVLAAYKSFTPPPGNTHDVIFAAIRHGYDVGVREADAENARLAEGVKSFMRMQDRLQAQIDAVKAWRVPSYPVLRTWDDLDAILNGEEPNSDD